MVMDMLLSDVVSDEKIEDAVHFVIVPLLKNTGTLALPIVEEDAVGVPPLRYIGLDALPTVDVPTLVT